MIKLGFRIDRAPRAAAGSDSAAGSPAEAFSSQYPGDSGFDSRLNLASKTSKG